MKKELSFTGKVILAGALIFVGYVIGWLLGATWGGNYATDVTWFGVRGYESTGAAMGYIVAACLGVVYAVKSAPQKFSLKSGAIPVLIASLFGIWLPHALQSYELTLFMACFPVLAVFAQGREKEERHMLVAIFFAILLLSNLFMIASLQIPLDNIWGALDYGAPNIPSLDDVVPME